MFQNFHFRPKPAVWLAWIMIKAPQLLKWQSGRKVEPVVISIVDLKSNSGRTPAGPALAFLKKFGLDVALDNVGLMEKFGLDKVDLAVDDQDSVYLTQDELKAEGYHGMTSVNLNGLYTYKVRLSYKNSIEPCTIKKPFSKRSNIIYGCSLTPFNLMN